MTTQTTSDDLIIHLPDWLTPEQREQIKRDATAVMDAAIKRGVHAGAPKCPEWCALGDAHAAEAANSLATSYFHASKNLSGVLGYKVEAQWLQQFDTANATADDLGVWIEQHFDLNLNVQGLVEDDARQLGEAILRAAELVEQVAPVIRC